MNISRKNGIRFFGSLVLSGTTLNSVGASTTLAMMDPESLTQICTNSTFSEIRNSDLYKYIEKTISPDELERISDLYKYIEKTIISPDKLERFKSKFEKDNLAAKSEDELFEILSATPLRKLVIIYKLASKSNDEKSKKIISVIKKAWELRLHEFSENYRKFFWDDENISPDKLCLKFFKLKVTDLDKFKLEDLFKIHGMFFKVLDEKYVLSGEDKCELSYSLFSSYLKIFDVDNPRELEGVAASLSQKDLRKILKYLLNKFPKAFDENICTGDTIRSLFNVALSCSSWVSGIVHDVLVLPLENLVKDKNKKNKDEFYKNLDLFKKDCKKLAQLLDKEAETVFVGDYMFNSNSVDDTMSLTVFCNYKMQSQKWARKLKV